MLEVPCTEGLNTQFIIRQILCVLLGMLLNDVKFPVTTKLFQPSNNKEGSPYHPPSFHEIGVVYLEAFVCAAVDGCTRSSYLNFAILLLKGHTKTTNRTQTINSDKHHHNSKPLSLAFQTIKVIDKETIACIFMRRIT